jgi:parvulin-like peptidyl-prolyl isomerase
VLKSMRQNAKYFYVLFFIVILSFIFWGVGRVGDSGKGGVVAEVGQYKITAEDYWRTYDRTFKFYRDLYKEKFDEDMQNKLNLKEAVLNSLIDSRVMLIAAKQNGITVSDEELNDAIRNEPAFMQNGAFSSEVYKNRLRLMRLTPEAYEDARRQELIIEKMSRLVTESVEVPEDELSKVSADEQTMKAIREAMKKETVNNALKAYVEGLKKEMKIKVNSDLVS